MLPYGILWNPSLVTLCNFIELSGTLWGIKNPFGT